MTATLRLTHAHALLRAIAYVHSDESLAPAERSAILTLLLGCIDDTAGDATLDALDAIFEDHSDTLPTAAVNSLIEAFDELTDACHALGQALSCSDTSAPKPRVTLIGQDGNAFAILVRCQDAANRARWNVEQWEAFRAEATAGDYDHLLRTVQTHFDVR